MEADRSLLHLLIVILSLNVNVYADDASSPTVPIIFGPVTVGGLIDGYLGHDFNNPDGKFRAYTTQFLHEDQAAINLMMLEAKLSTDNYRGRLAVQGGTSVEANYAAENDRFWRYIQESSMGAKLSDRLWIDAGIYLSHIGVETFNSSDNWNYTRSLVAEYSPYYETGVKLSYQFNDAVTGQLHFLRGWQNISNPSNPAVGMQLAYAMSTATQLTYANFIGDEHGQRLFHDFIGKTDLADDLSVALQFDVGSQERSAQSETVWWHGWSLMGQYRITPKVSLGGRVERFYDPHQIVLQTLTGLSYNSVGLSTNIDVELCPHLVWRNEYRVLLGRNEIFPKDDRSSKNDSFIVSSLTYTFR